MKTIGTVTTKQVGQLKSETYDVVQIVELNDEKAYVTNVPADKTVAGYRTVVVMGFMVKSVNLN